MSEQDTFRPRPAQAEILDYAGGRLGVSAVPGAGKTFTLSRLAADLVATAIDDDQEVLIVTLVNSAVDNFKYRIADFIRKRGLLKNVGYRVRTLHGLSNDIVRERPGLVGLADGFEIVDEREAEAMRNSAVEVWLRSNPDAADDFLDFNLDEGQRAFAREKYWPDTVLSVAMVFIKRAKDLQLGPRDLLERLEPHLDDRSFDLARMGAKIYERYQQSLYLRGGVDFDDLIRLALKALNQDPELVARLHDRWPFILEDEAQDSSLLQERILDKIVGPTGNWVRVGDPNQAINTTFTTADPKYLRNFLQMPGVRMLPLNNSGRSQQCIIDLANYLTEWTADRHPERRVHDALSGPPYIEPTPPDDPQPNPPTDPEAIFLFDRTFTPEAEIAAVVQSLQRWLPEHPDETVAVLVPRNNRGFQVTDSLKRQGIPYIELLRSTTSTRKTAGALGNVLQYLAKPTSSSRLARVFEVWRREDVEDAAMALQVKQLSSLLRRCRHVETFLWPAGGEDYLALIDWVDDPPVDDTPEDKADFPDPSEKRQFTVSDQALLLDFKTLVCRWQEATVLPIDQLVLTIAQDLFITAPELALSYKLAMMLRVASEHNPDWRLPELTQELAVIARNQRRFLGFSEDDTRFAPEPGKVTVSTLHKAKGLEWDRVYLLSVNNYNFPSAQDYDDYIGEKWFVRGQLNLEAEALAQLSALEGGEAYAEGPPTFNARLEYVRERLRLFYVGITRARKSLIVTWNTGRSRRQAKQMAVPFIALQTWWEDARERYEQEQKP